MDEALAAEAAGADRLELCRELESGGLSPDAGTLAAVLSRVQIPVNVLVRLRAGPFVADGSDVLAMASEVEQVLAAGANGVVVGLLGPDGRIDVEGLARLVTAAGERPVTFHRAFDEAPDLLEALQVASALGVARVLTGGGPGTALSGTQVLARLVRAGDGVAILAGGRVRADHVVHLVAATGVREVHARGEAVGAIVRALAASSSVRGGRDRPGPDQKNR